MSKDADMRSHVILSMIKVARAEADIPPLPSSATSSKLQQFLFKGSCSSLHMAGSCCNLTNFLVVFNILIILLRSNCQVIVALWRYRITHPVVLMLCHDYFLRYTRYNYYYNSYNRYSYHYYYHHCYYQYCHMNEACFWALQSLQYFKTLSLLSSKDIIAAIAGLKLLQTRQILKDIQIILSRIQYSAHFVNVISSLQC